jgi:uncharacterized protein YlxW (UPF0749 family)
MMAAIFLVLAVLDAALLTNVLLTNSRAGSVSVLDQPVTGFSQGQLLLLAAALGLLLALSLGIAWSSSSARRLRRRELRAERRGLESKVDELQRENTRLQGQLERTRRTGQPARPEPASTKAP